MRNFMCYRSDVPPLLFDGIRTACICGDNGNGKSTLIDAMTWALWGEARARSDDDLIHLGQMEMEVDFDFNVGGQLYRVIRKRSRPKRQGGAGRSSLDLFIGNNGNFQTISGDSIRETEQKIRETLLHMDYSTFINSAFLRQGHADEFTVKRPVERKQVLANILGLSLYDELEEQARNLAKKQEVEKAQLESVIRDIGDELSLKLTYEDELERAQDELSQIEIVAKEQESKLNELKREKESLESKKVQLAQIETHLRDTKRGLKRWEDQAQQHHTRLKEYEELITCRSTIEEGYTRLSSVKVLNDELDQKFRLVATLNDRKHRLEMKVVQAGEALITSHAVVQSRIRELETNSQKIPQFKDELASIQLQLNRLAEVEETLLKKRQNSRKLLIRIHHLESSRNQLEQEINDIEEKLNLLLTPGEAECPLCGTELGQEGIEFIEGKYTTDKQAKTNSLVSGQAELGQKRMELEALENEVDQLDTRIRQDKASLQNKAGILNQLIVEAREDGDKLTVERKELAEIEEHLAIKDFAIIEQEVLGKLEGELAGLDYNANQHEEVRRKLADLQQYEKPKQRLEEAERLISQERDAVSRAEEAVRDMQYNLEVDTQRKLNLTGELGRLPQLIDELTQAETKYKTISARQNQAQELTWQVRSKLQNCVDLETRKKERERKLAQVSKEEQIHKDLTQAFGKRGVQAWLIEIALPEIETEANRLLGRMTDNRMHIKIETQRPTKRGDLLETLDINISDELGTRNYEMFSGGEAFRINFAIRVALSRLLAKRAGAPLPTLIIDEGFGTQDSNGIEKVKEAINSIQDDFDKILVITHIDEIRDAFPARIDVVKTAEGSTFQVS